MYYPYAVVEGPQLTTNAVKKGLKMVDFLVDHFWRSTIS